MPANSLLMQTESMQDFFDSLLAFMKECVSVAAPGTFIHVSFGSSLQGFLPGKCLCSRLADYFSRCNCMCAYFTRFMPIARWPKKWPAMLLL